MKLENINDGECDCNEMAQCRIKWNEGPKIGIENVRITTKI